MLIPLISIQSNSSVYPGKVEDTFAGRVKSLAASYEDSIGAENIIVRRV